MSIVEKVKNVCTEKGIAHYRSDEEGAPNVLSRGRGKRRVSILLERTPVPHAVVDLDRIPGRCVAGMEIGDFMIFIDKNGHSANLIVPIEISHGKSKKATKIARQLESSATFALQHIVERSSLQSAG